MAEADVPMMQPQMMMTGMANDNKPATNAAPMVRFNFEYCRTIGTSLYDIETFLFVYI